MANTTIPQPSNNSADGYCKMPDGTLIQWGQISITRAKGINTSDLITYTFPFFNYPRTFAAINTSSYAPYFRVFPGENTKTTLRITLVNESDTAYSDIYASWLAIGRWKQ